MAKTPDNRFYILDVVRGQWEASEREKIIKQVAIGDGTDTIIYIEQEPGSGGKESAEATIRNLAGFRCIADRPTGDKIKRADVLAVQLNAKGGCFRSAIKCWQCIYAKRWLECRI